MTLLFLFFVGVLIILTQVKRGGLFVGLIIGYSINLFLVSLQRYVRPIFYSSDQQRFLDYANELMSMDFYSFVSHFDPAGSYLISWFAALVFRVLGSDLLYVNFFFVYAWMGTVITSYKLSLFITEKRRAATIISLFVAFIPSVSIINAAFLRESFIIFFLMSAFYYSCKWYVSRKAIFFLGSVFFMLLAGFFHGVLYFFVVLLVFFYLGDVFRRRHFRYADLVIILILVPFFAVVSLKLVDNVKVQVVISLFSSGGDSIEKYLSSNDDLDGFDDEASINALRLPMVDLNDPVSFGVSVVDRVFTFSYSPFLHQYYKLTDIPRIFDSIIFLTAIFLSFLIYKNGRSCSDARVRFYLSVFMPLIILLVVMFAIGSSDVGTSQRHRLKFFPVFWVITTSVYYLIQSKGRVNGCWGVSNG